MILIIKLDIPGLLVPRILDPRHEKTGVFPLRKQRRRSVSQ